MADKDVKKATDKDVKKATETSDTFLTGGNSYKLVSSSVKKNVLKNGLFVPVDINLISESGVDSDTGKTYTIHTNNNQNNVEVCFGFSPNWIKIKDLNTNRYVVLSSVEDIKVGTINVAQNVLTVKDFFDGIDFEAVFEPNGIKTSFTISKAKGQKLVAFNISGDLASFTLGRSPWYWDVGKPIQIVVPTSLTSTQVSYDFTQVPVGTIVDPTLVVSPAASANAGWVRNTGTVFATTRSATTGASKANNGACQAIAIFGSPTYYIDREAIQFDTSTIPVGATIVSATMQLYKYASQSPNLLGDVVHMVTKAAPITSTADFNISLWGSVSAGSFPSSPAAGYNSSNIDLTQITINTGGSTTIGFRCARDLNTTTPTAFDYTLFYDYDATKAAILTVNYTVGIPYAYSICSGSSQGCSSGGTKPYSLGNG